MYLHPLLTLRFLPSSIRRRAGVKAKRNPHSFNPDTNESEKIINTITFHHPLITQHLFSHCVALVPCPEVCNDDLVVQAVGKLHDTSLPIRRVTSHLYPHNDSVELAWCKFVELHKSRGQFFDY